MTTRKNWVPQHSIIVARDGKQVDAYEEYKKTGKAFTFEADEIKQILEHSPEALRSPADEDVDTTHAEVMSPGTDNVSVEGKEVAVPDEASPKPAVAKKARAVKDEDL